MLLNDLEGLSRRYYAGTRWRPDITGARNTAAPPRRTSTARDGVMMNLTIDATQAIGAAILLAVAGGWIVFSVYLLRWYLEDHVR